MDIQSTSRDLATPLSYKFYKAEDSGYHTSFATPSLESSTSLSNETLDPSLIVTNLNCKIKVDCYPITPAETRASTGRYYNYFNYKNSDSGCESTPLARRGVKRTYNGSSGQNEVNFTTVATPTSVIAKEVQKLKVNDNKHVKAASIDSAFIDPIDNNICEQNFYGSSVSNPTTPIKKICRNSCNLSPFNRRRSARKVDFAIHSLSCEKKVLTLPPKVQTKKSINNQFGYKPHQKIDIIKMLYSHEGYCSTSIQNILSYLTNEDVFNFTLVSPKWCNIFKNVITKQKYNAFFHTVKSNLENKGDTSKVTADNQVKPLREIQNINVIQMTPQSPTRSPRSTRFKKFTKAASLDYRSQMLCSNCRHPAKVTVESSGEEWCECTSNSCSLQFCKLCKCDRHPGKKCFQYDLDGPSPSKRKKNTCPVSSNKSKKKLKRLLF